MRKGENVGSEPVDSCHPTTGSTRTFMVGSPGIRFIKTAGLKDLKQLLKSHIKSYRYLGD